MFRIRLATTTYRPDLIVTIRSSRDNWTNDIPGIYEQDEWRFDLPEVDYQPEMEFKFLLERTHWMIGGNIKIQPVVNGDYLFQEAAIQFPLEVYPQPGTTFKLLRELVVERGYIQHLFFKPKLDETHIYDVIVIGSGIGGGILADQLSDLDVDVLVLEAGSYLFPTHVGNLPRQHQIGKFDKHIWSLFDEFGVANYENDDNSQYAGAQTFNLGGRSLFWGGLIPRMISWEMDLWPQDPIKWYLEDSGYPRAEDILNRAQLTPQDYPKRIKKLLRQRFADYNHTDAPMAVQYSNPNFASIPVGLFSTADLLMESMLADGPQGNQKLTINLNHAAVKIETDHSKATGVVAYDLIARRNRTFKGRAVVLAAGTIESAKLAKLSNLNDPNHKIGYGITDHPIFYTHFAIPSTSPYYDSAYSSKTLSQHKQATENAHPYNVVLELGADLNQGRYIDDELLARHQREKNNTMLCELVFLFNSRLVEGNRVEHNGPSYQKPVVFMQNSPAADNFFGEITAFKGTLFQELQAIPLANDNLNLKRAPLGGVAHEVGTLRLAKDGSGVVDTDLKFLGYDNLFVCDLSVFPTSPAANPTLTLTALAIRLSEHLQQQLNNNVF